MCLRDGSCDGGDHPSDHDAQFGCAELVTDLPASTFAFVLRQSTSFLPPTLDARVASLCRTESESETKSGSPSLDAQALHRPRAAGPSACSVSFPDFPASSPPHAPSTRQSKEQGRRSPATSRTCSKMARPFHRLAASRT